MSYIPKYIIKRMVPADAIKLVAGGLELNAINVISPLSVDGIPENINIVDYVDFKIDGTSVAADIKKGIKFTVGEGTAAKTFTMDKIREFEGVVIPVGGKMKIFVPNKTLKKGEEHTFDVVIKTDNPFNITVTRTIG
jgi:hypothetical protein